MTQQTNQATPVINPKLAQQLFERALQLLEAPCIPLNMPHSWIKHTMARDNYGHVCEPQSDNAVCYCELGAMKAVTYHLEPHELLIKDQDPVYRYLQSLFNMANPTVIVNDTVPEINDNSATTFPMVQHMFHKAIRVCDRFIKP